MDATGTDRELCRLSLRAAKSANRAARGDPGPECFPAMREFADAVEGLACRVETDWTAPAWASGFVRETGRPAPRTVEALKDDLGSLARDVRRADSPSSFGNAAAVCMALYGTLLDRMAADLP